MNSTTHISIRSLTPSAQLLRFSLVLLLGCASAAFGQCNLDLTATCSILTPPTPPAANNCLGKVERMVMRYTGQGCSASQNTQDPSKVACTTFGTLPDRVYIIASDSDTPGSGRRWFQGWVNRGEEYAIVASAGGSSTLTTDTRIHVFSGDPAQGGTRVQYVKFHTSCSQPLAVGNVFGGHLVVEMTTTEGGTVRLPGSNTDESTCCELPVPSGDYCQGKVEVLQMIYTGEGCGATRHSQDPSKVTCSGSGTLPDRVYIIASDSDTPGSGRIWFQGWVNRGEVFTIAASAGGSSTLTTDTRIHILDGQGGSRLQYVKFHTSCSQPLNLGDQFGAAFLYGIDTTETSLRTLGANVEFRYTLRNTGSVDINTLTVTDAFGPVNTSGVPLPLRPGQSATITVSKLLTDPVINNVTAVGNAGVSNCIATDRVLIQRASGGGAGKDCCENGKPTTLQMQYTGLNCSATRHTQDAGKVLCTDYGPLTDSVYIIASDSDTPGSGRIWFSGTVSRGGLFVLDPSRAGASSFATDTRLHIFDRQGGTRLQYVKFHTSCSQPLIAGDQYGTALLLDCCVPGQTAPPPITCSPDKTVECGVPWEFDPPPGGGCDLTNGIAEVVSTVTNRQCGNTMVATRTWRATSACGTTATCTQRVTVRDTTPPRITCRPDKTIECGTPVFDPPTATDTCGNVTVSIVGTVTNGLCGNTFRATRTWEARDDCGNTARCSQTVTVVDTTPPTLTCAPDKTVECGTLWNFDPPTATDACGNNVTITVVGTTTNIVCGRAIRATRTWRATDACGNSRECSQTVIERDTTPPVLTCSPNKTLECNGLWAFDTPAVSDTCGPVTVAILSTVTNALCGRTESATRTWRATDACGNFTDCSQTVTVVDTRPPTITCRPNKTVECGTPWTFDPPAASDSCSSNVSIVVVSTVTNRACDSTFVATRTWRATDACSNSVTCSQRVTVEDTTPPGITCKADKSVECGTPWDFDPPTVTDNCSSGTNLTLRVVSTVTNVLCGNTLEATRTWEARDGCDNVSRCSQKVTVVDTTPPVITCATNKVEDCRQPWTFDPPTATDACGAVTVFVVSTVTNVISSTTTIITRTWEARDQCTNTARCSQVVTVICQPLLAGVGDLVWHDVNNNGLVDPGEQGIDQVPITLVGVGPDGQPFTGDDVPVGTQLTAANGFYLFTGVTPGRYFLVISNPPPNYPYSSGPTDPNDNQQDNDDNGFQPLGAGTRVFSPVFQLSTNETDLTLDFGLLEPTLLGNQVWNDQNNNGLRDPGEPGLDNVRVTLVGVGPDGVPNTPDDETFGTTLTSGGGIYEFVNMPPGQYFVVISNPPPGFPISSTITDPNDNQQDNDDNGIQPTPGGSTTSPVITISTGERDLTVDFGFLAPASLGNLVWNDANNNGQRDPNEPGLDGVPVTLRSLGPDGLPGTPDDLTQADTVTSSGGFYNFPNLAPGQYYVVLSNPPSGFPLSSTPTDPNDNREDNDDNGIQPTLGGTTTSPVITLSGGENDPTVDFGFLAPASLGNQVWNDLNNNGQRDPAEPGLDDVPVTLVGVGPDGMPGTPDDVPLGTTITTNGGIYTFPNLPPGQYFVVVSNPPPATPLSSTPTDPNDNQEDNDDNGLQPTPGGPTTSPVITLTQGENDPTVDFGFLATAALGNLVWNDANNNGLREPGEFGLGGVPVTLVNVGPDGLPGTPDDTTVRTIFTDGDGIYNFDNLSPGRYLVVLSNAPGGYPLSSTPTDTNDNQEDNDDNGTQTAPGGRTVSPVITLSSGEVDPTIDFGFLVPASLGNQVWNDLNNNGQRDPGEPGLDGVPVTLVSVGPDGVPGTPDDVTTGDTVTSNGGIYTFSNLPPGQYFVVLTNPPPGLPVSSTLTDPNDNREDNDDNGIQPTPGAPTASPVITLSQGESDPTIDFGFLLPAALGNFVWNDANNNGQREPGEAPIDGVRVTLVGLGPDSLFGTLDDVILNSMLTSGGGIYNFTNLAPGQYVVVLSNAPAGFPLSSAVTDPLDNQQDNDDNGAQTVVGGQTVSPVITLSIGEVDPTVDFGFLAPASIGNLVWNDNNNNGQRDPGEPGLDGVPVTLVSVGPDGVPGTPDDTPVGNTTTSNGGIYEFNNVPPGQYYVVLENPPPGFPVSSTPTDPNDNREDNDDNGIQPTPGGRTTSPVITLTQGENDPTVDFGFLVPASLGNLVWNDVNDNGLRDPGEVGLDGVPVTLVNAGLDGVPGTPDDTTVGTILTSSGGLYGFNNLTPGLYYVVLTNPPAGYPQSSTPTDTSDNQQDNDDNGTQTAPGGRTVSPLITLSSGENDPTIDFGFLSPPLLACIGDLVWDDKNANGLQDTNEPGIGGAVLLLFACGQSNVLQTTVTDTNGIYQFCDLEPGSYQLRLLPPVGWVVTTQTNGPDRCVDSDADASGLTTCVTVQAGTVTNCTDIGLFKYAGVGDYVWQDVNGNGIQDGNEPPVPNVTVQLYACGGTNVLATRLTDGSGLYLFGELKPGSYQVRFIAPPGLGFTTQNAPGSTPANDSDAGVNGLTACVTLPEGVTNRTVDAGLQGTACVGDFVWDDKNVNGLQDPNEAGIGGVTVQLFACGQSNVLRSTVTDTNGIYLFCDLVPGSYQVKVLPPNGWAITTQTNGPDRCVDSDANAAGLTPCVTVMAGTVTNCTDIGLFQLAGIGDFVWEDLNGNGIQDTNEPPVPNVPVVLFRASDNSTVGSQLTDGNGLYLFGGLKPGPYYVVFFPPVGFQFTTRNAPGSTPASDSDANASGQTAVVTLPGGVTNRTVDAGVLRTACVGDYVWYDQNLNGIQDVDEVGVGGVTLLLLPCGQSNVLQTTVTTSNGFYLFCNLVPGNYQVKVLPPNGWVATTQTNGPDRCVDSDADAGGLTTCVTVQSGMVTNCTDIGLFKSAGLGDYVWEDVNGNGIQDGNEPPVPNVTVQLFACGGTNVLATRTTDASGLYLFGGLKPGSYSVRFVAPAGYKFTTQNALGSNPANDSDAGAGGTTACVTLPEGVTNRTVDAGLLRTACVGDLVWNDKNANGIQEANEPGIGGVLLLLLPCGQSNVLQTTVTDTNGIYRFCDLDPGSYQVRVLPPNGWVVTTQTNGPDRCVDSDADATGLTTCVTVQSGTVTNCTDIGLFKYAGVGDYVWQDLNGNGIQDGNEPPLPNVLVQLYACGETNVLTTRTTDAQGRYVFGGLKPGSYQVRFIAPPGYQFTLLNAPGSTPANDSDAGTGGLTACVSLPEGVTNLTFDAGLIPSTTVTITCAADKTAECGMPWQFDPPTASSTCGSVTVTIVSTVTNTAGACGNTYTATRTWRATDACGNSAQCSQRVTVTDTTPPVITCARNKELECGGPVSFDPPTATDTCGTTSIEVLSTVTNILCGNAFRVVRTWRAMDACSNSATCSQTLTLRDTTVPTLLCAPAKTVECGTPWTFDEPIANDACGPVTVTVLQTISNIYCPNTLTAVRVWQATDGCGNIATCAQVVSVLDVTPPQLTCAPNKTVDCRQPWTFDPPTATDACSRVTVVVVSTVTNVLSLDVTVVTRRWEARDECGNAAQCTQSVTVNCPPQVAALGDLVWNDANNNGQRDPGEAGLDGVPVTLVRVGPDGLPGTPDDVTVGTTLTSNGGIYGFANLPPGQYFVVLSNTPAGFPLSSAVTDPNDNQEDNDDNGIQNVPNGPTFSPVISLVAGETDNTVDFGFLRVTDLQLVCGGPKTAECGSAWNFDQPTVSGGCMPVNVTIVSTLTNALCGQTFTAVRTWRATDACGNVATCSQAVTIQDTTPPLITCARSKEVECGTPWTFDPPTTSDTCGQVALSVVNTVTNQQCGATFVATRTWEARDDCGNTAQCSQTVVVTDRTPPVLLGVPGDATYECERDVPPVVNVTAFDACNGTNVLLFASSSIGIDGCGLVIFQTWGATDPCGNTASKGRTVRIRDLTAPTLVCPADRTVECGTPWQFGQPNASDNCEAAPQVRVVSTVTNALCGGSYVAIRTWEATDACTNATRCSQRVTVLDTTPPVILCAPNKTADCRQPWSFDPPAANDLCGQASLVIVSTVTNVLNPITKVITRTWRATDGCGNSAECSQVVTETCTSDLVLRCAVNKTVECGTPWAFDEPTVIGGCPPVTVTVLSTITNQQCGNTFTATRTWQAVDACDSKVTCSQTVTVRDTTPPAITCAGDREVACGTPWSFNPPAANDTCGTVNVREVGTVTNAQCGGTFVATRTWEATDGCGNTARCSQRVTVRDTTPPVITCLPNKTTDCRQPWTFDPPTATDTCNGATVIVVSTVTNVVNPTTKIITRTWRATDGCGNTAECSQVVTETCTSDLNLVCAANKFVECGTAWVFDPPTVIGGCQPVNVTIVSTVTNAGTCGGTFTATRTWRATDACGGTATCSQTVTIKDTTPPAITCAPNKTVECGAVWAFDPPTATDTCGPATVVVLGTVTNGLCGKSYSAVRTWQATDACGNQSTCSQTVTVRDTMAPVANCPPNKTVECGTPWTFDAPTGLDLCSGADVTVLVVSTETNRLCGNTLVATRSWLVTDGCSNSTPCTQTVTVRDTTPPVITCAANKTVDCRTAWTFDPPTASDTCNGATVTMVSTVTNVVSPELSIVTRRWEARDGCGNTAQCSQVVTVNCPPQTATIGNQVWNDLNNNGQREPGEPGLDGVPVTLVGVGPDGVPGTPDDVTVGTILTSSGGFYQFSNVPPGRYFVVLTNPPAGYPLSSVVTDTADNRQDDDDNGIQNVNGGLTQSPVITLDPGETDNTVDFGFLNPGGPNIVCGADKTAECGVAWSFDPPTATSGCPPVTIQIVSTVTNAGTCGSTYTAVRTWRATDACGGTATCSQRVNVRDTLPPTILCGPDKDVECGAPWTFDTPTAADTCNTVQVTVVGTVTNPICGSTYTTTRRWRATDACGNAAECTQTVTVRDTIPPVLVCGVDKTAECGGSWTFDQPVALDLCGATAVRIVSTVTNAGPCGGTYAAVRTWEAADDCGNTARCSQQVSVMDVTPPSIVCGANKTANCRDPWTFDEPTASDTCSVATVRVVSTETNILSATVYVVTRTWEASDPCGNRATCTQTVTVSCEDAFASLGNQVWNDANNNGLLDNSELGIDDIQVTAVNAGPDGRPFTPDDITVGSMLTARGGFYLFTNLPPGKYFVVLTNAPANYPVSSTVTDANDNREDNDDNGFQPLGNGTRAFSPVIDLSAGESDLTVDFGFFKPVPTVALVTRMQAYEAGGQVVVEWQTGAESGTVGFNLYRLDDRAREWLQVNGELVVALNSIAGGIYRLADPGASLLGPNTYVLMEVEITGDERLYGPYVITVEARSKELVALGAEELPLSPAFEERIVAAKAEQLSAESGKRRAKGTHIKLVTREAGMHYVSVAELAQVTGHSTAYFTEQLAAGTLALYNLGHPVSYARAAGDLGLYFYAEKLENVYTRQNVYWLAGGENLPPEVLPTLSTTPNAGGWFWSDFDQERDLIPVLTVVRDPAQDHWMWASVIGSTPSYSKWTNRFDLPQLATGVGGNTHFSLRLLGGSTDRHRVRVELNGNLLGEGEWLGNQPYQLQVNTLPVAWLRATGNELKITALTGPGSTVNLFYVDGYQLRYPRYLVASGGQLEFTAVGQTPVTVSGLPTAQIGVWEISDPREPKQLDGFHISSNPGDGKFQASFVPPVANGRYVVYAPEGLKRAVRVSGVQLANLSGPGNAADYLVVAPRSLVGAAQELALYRQAQGHLVKVIELEDIYNEFSYGVAEPLAMRDMLAYAFEAWATRPQYVVMTADGSYDYRDLLGRGDNLLPPGMVATDFGLMPSDCTLGDVDGDGRCEVAFGRLPALTVAELTRLIQKIKAYEAGSLSTSRRALLVADKPDSGGQFIGDSVALEGLVGSSFNVNRAYMGSGATVDSVRSLIQTQLRAGTEWMNYVGHGAFDRMGLSGAYLTMADVTGMNNSERLPLVTAMTCVLGQFAEPGRQCLGEAMLMKDGGGAIAVWAPSGYSLDAKAQVLNRAFTEALVKTKTRRVGDMVREAAQEYLNQTNDRNFPGIYNLLGDPALRLR